MFNPKVYINSLETSEKNKKKLNAIVYKRDFNNALKALILDHGYTLEKACKWAIDKSLEGINKGKVN